MAVKIGLIKKDKTSNGIRYSCNLTEFEEVHAKKVLSASRNYLKKLKVATVIKPLVKKDKLDISLEDAIKIIDRSDSDCINGFDLF